VAVSYVDRDRTPEAILIHLLAFAGVTGTKAEARIPESLQDLTLLVVRLAPLDLW
jgi:hypothetical protein